MDIIILTIFNYNIFISKNYNKLTVNLKKSIKNIKKIIKITLFIKIIEIVKNYMKNAR